MARTGRPSKLTPELRDAIAERVKVGIGLEKACRLENISPRTALFWMRDGRAAELREENGDELTDSLRARLDFFRAVDRARAEFEFECLRRLQQLELLTDAKLASATVKALTWILERLFRDTYGSHITVKVEEAKGEFLAILERVCDRLGATEVLEAVLDELERVGSQVPGEPQGEAERVH